MDQHTSTCGGMILLLSPVESPAVPFQFSVSSGSYFPQQGKRYSIIIYRYVSNYCQSCNFCQMCDLGSGTSRGILCWPASISLALCTVAGSQEKK